MGSGRHLSFSISHKTVLRAVKYFLIPPLLFSAYTAQWRCVSTLSRGGRGIAVGFGPYDCRRTIIKRLMFLTHTGHSLFFCLLPGGKREVKLLRNKRSEQNGFKIIRLEWTQWSFFVAPKWFLHVVPKTCGLSVFRAPASLSNKTHWSDSLNDFCLETQGTYWDAKLFHPFVRIYHENRLPFALCTFAHFTWRLIRVQCEIMLHIVCKTLLQLERRLIYGIIF